VADLTLEKVILQEVLAKKLGDYWSYARRRTPDPLFYHEKGHSIKVASDPRYELNHATQPAGTVVVGSFGPRKAESFQRDAGDRRELFVIKNRIGEVFLRQTIDNTMSAHEKLDSPIIFLV